MDHFTKVCKEFACFLTGKLLIQLVLASPFSVRIKPRVHNISKGESIQLPIFPVQNHC